jgi:hypothetical protein
MSQCATIKYLQNIATGYEHSLASAAKSALCIIYDIQENGPKHLDIELLYLVVDAVYKESGASLFDHLIEGTPDCEICTAIKVRISPASNPLR